MLYLKENAAKPCRRKMFCGSMDVVKFVGLKIIIVICQQSCFPTEKQISLLYFNTNMTTLSRCYTNANTNKQNQLTKENTNKASKFKNFSQQTKTELPSFSSWRTWRKSFLNSEFNVKIFRLYMLLSFLLLIIWQQSEKRHRGPVHLPLADLKNTWAVLEKGTWCFN